MALTSTPQTIYVPKEAVATYQATEPNNQYPIEGVDYSVGIGKVEMAETPKDGWIYDLKGRLVCQDGNLQAPPPPQGHLHPRRKEGDALRDWIELGLIPNLK